jgi:hypothetical protein
MRPVLNTKKGAPLFEAAFSLADSIMIVSMKNGLSKRYEFSKGSDEFSKIIESTKNARSIEVLESMLISDASSFLIKNKGAVTVVSKIIGPDETFNSGSVYTATIQRIKDLAYELNSDKEVDEVSLKPAQPKKSMKDRTDTI